MYARQCLRYGRNVGTYLAYRDVPSRDSVPEWDRLLESATYSRRTEWFEAKQAAQSQTWWDEYNDYLESDAWAEKRKAVLERDHHLCQSCVKAKATVIHHLTYEHRFNEPLFDLVSVCEECHAKIHGRDA